MKKHLYLLAAAFLSLSFAFLSCEKPDDNPVDPGTSDTAVDPGDNNPSQIIATTFEEPVRIYRKGKITIAGIPLWFDMMYESCAYFSPYEGMATLCTPSTNRWRPLDNVTFLEEGAEIGPAGYFSTNDSTYFMSWYGKTDPGYCGISFQKDGKPHYGWVCFSFNTVSCIALIYGYGYENAPGRSIKAGAKE